MIKKYIEIEEDIDEFMIFIKSIYTRGTAGMSFFDQCDIDLARRSCDIGLLEDVSENCERAYLPTDIAKLLYKL